MLRNGTTIGSNLLVFKVRLQVVRARPENPQGSSSRVRVLDCPANGLPRELHRIAVTIKCDDATRRVRLQHFQRVTCGSQSSVYENRVRRANGQVVTT